YNIRHVTLDSYCDHLDLHSFPTRRSSDLQEAIGKCIRNRLDVPGVQFQKIGVIALLAKNVLAINAAIKNMVVLAELQRCQPIHRDRKSTRLNSSHDQISYAVFCLKKKNIY